MNDVTKLQFLKDSIQTQIDSFQRQRQKNKTISFSLKISMVTFGALTTVLLGLKGFSNETEIVFKNMALILSAGLTLFSAIEAFFDHRELWIRYTTTATLLMSLKAEIDFRSSNQGIEVPEIEIEKYFERYQSILRETNEFWNRLRNSEKSEKNSTEQVGAPQTPRLGPWCRVTHAVVLLTTNQINQ